MTMMIDIGADSYFPIYLKTGGLMSEVKLGKSIMVRNIHFVWWGSWHGIRIERGGLRLGFGAIYHLW